MGSSKEGEIKYCVVCETKSSRVNPPKYRDYEINETVTELHQIKQININGKKAIYQ